MAYVTMADLGLSDSSDLLAQADQADKQAGALWDQAQMMESGSPAQQGLLQQADALHRSAESLRAQAAALKPQEDADSAATQKNVFDLIGKVLDAGAKVGTTVIQTEAQKKAASANKFVMPTTPARPSQQQPSSSGGLSTGAIIGLSVLGIAVVGTVLVIALRPQQPIVVKTA